MTPDSLERLLFDDIPYLPVAQEEHDEFVRILKDNGVDVDNLKNYEYKEEPLLIYLYCD